MKCLLIFNASVLLLLTQTAIVNCDSSPTAKVINVKESQNSIELSCPENYYFPEKEIKIDLLYKDSNSGEYKCEKDREEPIRIFVKFRTCDNCVELDMTSIIGMAIGDVVATCVVGVAVYLFASVIQTGRVTSIKKRSNRQLPSPRGASNDPYQALRFNSPKDEYDKLDTKR